MLAAAVPLGVSAAALAHGVFESMQAVIGIGMASTFVLLTIGSIFRAWPRTQGFGASIVFCGMCTFAAIPIAYFAARGVVKVDEWRAKRYITFHLGPHLESIRRARGQYPAELRLWERPPANAPWLIRRFNYTSDGRRYTLWVMDPGVCGRITSYSSATRQWTETYDPCWY